MLERTAYISLVAYVTQVGFEDESDLKRHNWVDRGLRKNPLTRLDVDINKTKQKKKEARSGAAKNWEGKRQRVKYQNLQSMDAGALSTVGHRYRTKTAFAYQHPRFAQ